MEEKEILLTKEGHQKIVAELEDLKTTKRKDLAKRLKEAISYGDLSENSEYQEAKSDQAFLEGRIIELEEMLINAKIIKDHQKNHLVTDQIELGSSVKIKILDDAEDKGHEFMIVGFTEADPLNHKISNESPIGAAILGKKKGDVVDVVVPSGDTIKYKIMACS